jgi:hypothetical protein
MPGAVVWSREFTQVEHRPGSPSRAAVRSARARRMGSCFPPDSTPLCSPGPWPSRTHALTVARAPGVIQACVYRQVLVLADRAYRGAGATLHARLPEQYAEFNRGPTGPGVNELDVLLSWRFDRARCRRDRDHSRRSA